MAEGADRDQQPDEYTALLEMIAAAATAPRSPPPADLVGGVHMTGSPRLLCEQLAAAGAEHSLVVEPVSSVAADAALVPALQLRVHEQIHPNCCGYHSIHNAATVRLRPRALSHSTAPPPPSRMRMLQPTRRKYLQR